MVFISAGHVYAPVSAASRCTFPTHSVKRIYGCSLSFFARLAGFRQPFFSNHPFQFCRGFKAHPVPRAVRAVTQGYMGYRQRKTKRKLSCRRAHSQETRDNKPSIALQCHVSFLSTRVDVFAWQHHCASSLVILAFSSNWCDLPPTSQPLVPVRVHVSGCVCVWQQKLRSRSLSCRRSATAPTVPPPVTAGKNTRHNTNSEVVIRPADCIGTYWRYNIYYRVSVCVYEFAIQVLWK